MTPPVEESSSVLVGTDDDGVMTLTLNRPDRLNALNFELIEAATAALESARDDLVIRCVVLRGAGRAFCAGDDIKGMGSLPDGVDPVTKEMYIGYRSLVRALRFLPKPVIACVHGYALGAGLELVLACDIKIVGEEAQLGVPYINLGIADGAYELPRTIGTTRAVDLLFTGRQIDGRTALDYGIATEVVPESELETSTRRWAEHLKQMPTRTLGFLKRLVYSASELDFERGMETLAMLGMLSDQTEDYLEGKAAWREKREPRFIGR